MNYFQSRLDKETDKYKENTKIFHNLNQKLKIILADLIMRG